MFDVLKETTEGTHKMVKIHQSKIAKVNRKARAILDSTNTTGIDIILTIAISLGMCEKITANNRRYVYTLGGELFALRTEQETARRDKCIKNFYR